MEWVVAIAKCQNQLDIFVREGREVEVDYCMKKIFHPPSPWFEGYDLVAVLIHKGRSVDSGHYYVAWVKQDSQKWIEFDDEQPILQKEDNITKLSGGGDWHMAYICLYKAQVALPH
jgi:uncharacterized UBP type Zn finger protein